jgi:hypothetical protein
MADDLRERAELYLRRDGRILGDALGNGVQGSVFLARHQACLFASAVKVHRDSHAYRRERDVYLHLKECGVSTIRGCNVPTLFAHDDGLMILEMEIVVRPFCLDFGGAYLMYPPDFPEGVLEDVDRQHRELFEEDYDEMKAVLRELERLDIHMVDVHPGNISFRIP